MIDKWKIFTSFFFYILLKKAHYVVDLLYSAYSQKNELWNKLFLAESSVKNICKNSEAPNKFLNGNNAVRITPI